MIGGKPARAPQARRAAVYAILCVPAQAVLFVEDFRALEGMNDSDC